ncbi:MAG: DoxX family membrane protein [Acidobacteria bacterium]|nr:DoxX family membrane protein [Acidobacteriota bacterium]
MAGDARPRAAGGGAAGAIAAGMRVLAVLLGVFFLFMGLDKISWLADSEPLAQRFERYLRGATPAVRWYIETLALPGLPLFARLVPLAEMATGAALVAGFWTRLASALAFVMVLNFHFASGTLLQWGFLTDGFGLPVLGGLLALAIGAKDLPISVSKQ